MRKVMSRKELEVPVIEKGAMLSIIFFMMIMFELLVLKIKEKRRRRERRRSCWKGIGTTVRS